jgi:1-acyl-sn-glycerol-3-phosphate acyltransferase
VVLFPEGTRSPDGEIRDFKMGAFKIAHETGAPILPIVVDGTRDALPKHGWVLRESLVARVRVLPPITPRPGDTPEATAAHVRSIMVDELAQLRGRRAAA